MHFIILYKVACKHNNSIEGVFKMAVSREEKKTTLYLNVEVGEDSYKNRSFTNINPLLTDDLALSTGEALGTLQTHTLNKVVRRDEATLIEA